MSELIIYYIGVFVIMIAAFILLTLIIILAIYILQALYQKYIWLNFRRSVLVTNAIICNAVSKRDPIQLFITNIRRCKGKLNFRQHDIDRLIKELEEIRDELIKQNKEVNDE